MRQIEILWRSLGASVKIVLDEGRNSDLIEPLWRSLPYKSLQGHALVAGDCLYHVPPAHEVLCAVPDYKVDRKIVPNGTVFCSAVQHLTIKYGELTEPMPASPIGNVIPEDVPSLAEIGRRVWESVRGNEPPIIAEVRRAGGSSGHSVRRLACQSSGLQDLIEEIAAETESALIAPPQELIDIHEGRNKSNAGTRQSTLTTLVFVNGETRPLGYMTYSGLLRASKLANIPLGSLLAMAKILLVKPSEFLGYCGLETLWKLTQRVVSSLDTLASREDFEALMTHMALYVNALGAWNLQLFPWGLEATAKWSYRPMLAWREHAA